MPDRTQDLTNLRKVATACKNYTDKKIDDLKWELGSNTLDVESDTTTAYTKTVPSGTLGCHINKIGGMSYKSENLLSLQDVAETTTNGVTYKIENGVVKLISRTEGTADNADIPLCTIQLNGAYTYRSFASQITGSFMTLAFDSNNNMDFILQSDSAETKTQTFDNDTYTFKIRVSGALTINGQTMKPMLVKGSTTPTEYQPYFEGIRDSAVTSVVSKDSNDTTLDTFTIPAEVQALEDYGLGINDTCYNYIYYDITRKKWYYVQKVIRIPLKDLSWSESAPASHNFRGNLDSYVGIIDVPNANVTATAIMKKYTAKDWNAISLTDNYCFAIGVRSTQSTVITLIDNDYSTNEAFINSIQNDYLYIKLATPIETDISAYIEDGTIVIEPNGTITFTNTYEQAVPSEVDYLIEEVKA